jgi:hypothetical protein
MKELLELIVGGIGFCLLVGGVYVLFQKKDRLLASVLLMYGVAIVPRMIWPDVAAIGKASLLLRLFGILLLMKYLIREQKAAKEKS